MGTTKLSLVKLSSIFDENNPIFSETWVSPAKTGLTDPTVKNESGNEWIVMFSTADYTPVHVSLMFE